METLLANCIQRNLGNFMFENAIFLCERLYAEFPTEGNLQLLARCYLSSNQAYSAYCILQGLKTPQSRYLFALSCFELEHLNEAEAALLPNEEDFGVVPNGAAGHYILGLVYRYTGRTDSSVQHFRRALTLDPLFWEAYEELCMLGAAEEADDVFGDEAFQRIQELYVCLATNYSKTTRGDGFSDSGRSLEDSKNLKHVAKNEQDTNVYHSVVTISSGSETQGTNGSQTSLSSCNTPSPVAPQLADVAPPALCKNVHGLGGDRTFVYGDHHRKFVAEEKPKKVVKMVPMRLFSESSLRRSARLAARRITTSSKASGSGARTVFASSSDLSTASSLSSTTDKSQTASSEEGPLMCSTDAVRFFDNDTSSKPGSLTPNLSGTISGIRDTLNLLRLIGEGHRLLSMYKCKDAVLVFQKLSQKQYHTRWVLSQVGKAYFELLEYHKADGVFSLARQISPYTLEGMDIYSTVLYHLKEEMKLSYLAQELLSIDRLASESWFAVGNCYSMQKDHGTALKIFERCIQLKPRFAYAHTMCGHECIASEDYDDAEQCYRKALGVDSRHYNAWYGLGIIYLRQEKFDFAMHHFQQALQINPHSSVIMCYIGVALHELQRHKEALEMLRKAIIADSRNPLPRYYKANVLVTLGAYDEAAKVLEELKEYTPKESSVHALLGKIYKQLKLYNKAVLHFGIALDLHPPVSDAAHIKVCMERLIVPDEDDDL